MGEDDSCRVNPQREEFLSLATQIFSIREMIAARSVVIRITVAGAGVLFLSTVLVVALGWALSTGQPWLFNLLKRERFDRLHGKFDHAAALFWTGDGDHDGV